MACLRQLSNDSKFYMHLFFTYINRYIGDGRKVLIFLAAKAAQEGKPQLATLVRPSIPSRLQVSPFPWALELSIII